MKELVVISGKGGTGKTSIVACFAALADQRAVIADVDVDAADLHLVLEPRVFRREDFFGGRKARIKAEHCRACGQCKELCRFDAVYYDGPASGRVKKTFRIDPLACEGCGVCVRFCPAKAIEFAPAICGQWFVSDTRCGPMLHAKLRPGAENSGKLVTRIRQAAQQLAAERGLELILCDGSPGIGCPVIASLTGASLALVVTEPTLTGVHDFGRIADLLDRLGVPGLMVVNKADLNPALAVRLEQAARRRGIQPVGRIPYDSVVTAAQIAGRTVIETSAGAAAKAICSVWQKVSERIAESIPAGSALVPLHI